VSRDGYFLTFATKSARSNTGLQIGGIRATWDQLIAQNQDSEQALIEERRRKLIRAPMVSKSTAQIVVQAKDLARPPSAIAVAPAQPTAAPAPPSGSGRKHGHKKFLPPPKVAPAPPPRTPLSSDAPAAAAAKPARQLPKPPPEAPPPPQRRGPRRDRPPDSQQESLCSGTYRSRRATRGPRPPPRSPTVRR
jgi:hypothetical protein